MYRSGSEVLEVHRGASSAKEVEPDRGWVWAIATAIAETIVIEVVGIVGEGEPPRRVGPCIVIGGVTEVGVYVTQVVWYALPPNGQAS
jgi:hypothetical protein